MFALVAEDVLYFKATDRGAALFEAEGCPRWRYANTRRTVSMPYWQVPERLMDDPDEFLVWASAAWDAAIELRPKIRARRGNKHLP